MEYEELETGDEGLGSECSSESGSCSHRGLDAGVYPSSNARSLDSIPLVLHSRFDSTVEVNKTESIRSTWNGDININGTLTSQAKNFGKVSKEEKQYRNTNVRYVVYGKSADTTSNPEKQNTNYPRTTERMNGNSAHRKIVSRGKSHVENNKSNGTAEDFIEPEPFKYVNVWRPYPLGNKITNTNTLDVEEHFCKAITHYEFTPRVFPTGRDRFANGKVGLLLCVIFFCNLYNRYNILQVFFRFTACESYC